jgi:hypothetical protein
VWGKWEFKLCSRCGIDVKFRMALTGRDRTLRDRIICEVREDKQAACVGFRRCDVMRRSDGADFLKSQDLGTRAAPNQIPGIKRYGVWGNGGPVSVQKPRSKSG